MSQGGSRDWVRDLPSFVRALLTTDDELWDSGETSSTDLSTLDDEGRETVEALVDLGLDEDDAVTAVRDGAVALAIVRHQRRGRARHTLDDLVERSGVPADVIVELQVAMGLEVRDAYTKDDVVWARSVRDMLDVVPIAAVVRAARTRGAALAAIARSDLTMARDELVLPLRAEGADDVTVAVALAEAARALLPLSTEALLHGYERVLDHELASELTQLSASAGSVEVPVAIGFLDVVGYTALSARVDPSGLDRLLDAFEERCATVVHAADGVSIVKYLGDAVMLVAARAEPLAEVMLELATEVEQLEDAPLRGAMAYGPTILREGDYFGTPVNLAARLTDMARPWTVLASEETGAGLTGYEVVATRPMQLRGFGTHRPWRVRRAG